MWRKRRIINGKVAALAAGFGASDFFGCEGCEIGFLGKVQFDGEAFIFCEKLGIIALCQTTELFPFRRDAVAQDSDALFGLCNPGSGYGIVSRCSPLLCIVSQHVEGDRFVGHAPLKVS